MAMQPGPGATFEMVETKFLLELLVRLASSATFALHSAE
jgi:hypothetical protein